MTCLGDVVLVDLIVPGPPLTAAGHLAELGTLLLASNVVSLTNLHHYSQLGPPWSGPGLTLVLEFTSQSSLAPSPLWRPSEEAEGRRRKRRR